MGRKQIQLSQSLRIVDNASSAGIPKLNIHVVTKGAVKLLLPVLPKKRKDKAEEQDWRNGFFHIVDYNPNGAEMTVAGEMLVE